MAYIVRVDGGRVGSDRNEVARLNGQKFGSRSDALAALRSASRYELVTVQGGEETLCYRSHEDADDDGDGSAAYAWVQPAQD